MSTSPESPQTPNSSQTPLFDWQREHNNSLPTMEFTLNRDSPFYSPDSDWDSEQYMLDIGNDSSDTSREVRQENQEDRLYFEEGEYDNFVDEEREEEVADSSNFMLDKQKNVDMDDIVDIGLDIEVNSMISPRQHALFVGNLFIVTAANRVRLPFQSCPICLTSFEETQELIVLRCHPEHVFCISCIGRLASSQNPNDRRCALCRAQF